MNIIKIEQIKGEALILRTYYEGLPKLQWHRKEHKSNNISRLLA